VVQALRSSTEFSLRLDSIPPEIADVIVDEWCREMQLFDLFTTAEDSNTFLYSEHQISEYAPSDAWLALAARHDLDRSSIDRMQVICMLAPKQTSGAASSSS
jgi:hypothetical protein